MIYTVDDIVWNISAEPHVSEIVVQRCGMIDLIPQYLLDTRLPAGINDQIVVAYDHYGSPLITTPFKGDKTLSDLLSCIYDCCQRFIIPDEIDHVKSFIDEYYEIPDHVKSSLYSKLKQNKLRVVDLFHENRGFYGSLYRENKLWHYQDSP